jgi:putative peptide zinc metalloprotease protein
MHRVIRSVLTVGLGFLLAASTVAGTQAQESQATSVDTAAVAVNTKDGSTVFRIKFQILRNTSDVVDNINIAFAWGSCQGCSTIATSFQVVLVTGDPSVVTNQNYAIAINWECVDCQTLAAAFQWVKSTGGQFHFSPEGQRALASIRADLYRLMSRADTMTVAEVAAELDALAVRVAQVLVDELVLVGAPEMTVQTEEGSVEQSAAPQESPTVPPSPGISPSAPATSTGGPTPTETTSPAPDSPSPTVAPSATTTTVSPTP